MNDAHKQQQLWFEHLWPWVHRRDNTVIIDRIDHTLDGLCPCGATPRPDSPYCSYDCEPTHIARNTDTRTTGALATPMRWRPDLVSAAPDDGLTLLAGSLRRGPYTAHILRRDATGRLHMRLDDGYRFVGCDVDTSDPDYDPETVWARLERELADPRHTAPAPASRPRRPAMPEVTVHSGTNTTTITAHRTGPAVDHLIPWLRRNGLDPHRVPLGAPLQVTATHITVAYTVLDDGYPVLDLGSPHSLLTQRLTVPLVEPLPADLDALPGVHVVGARTRTRPEE